MASLWADGLTLTMLGMGMVFCFLALLVLCLNGMSTVIAKINKPSKNTVSEQELAAVAVAALINANR